MIFLRTIKPHIKRVLIVVKMYFSLIRSIGHVKKAKLEQTEIIVSLTTYRLRISKVHWTLKSIILQESMPAKIILVLASEEFPNKEHDLPKKLMRLVSENANVELLWVQSNIRSYKKLLPSLHAFPHSAIITIDDDVFYPPTLIKSFHINHKLYPLDILGTRGHNIGISLGEIAPYSSWTMAKEGDSGLNVLLTGCGGILYPPNSLSFKVFEIENATELAPDADDLWFKVMGLLQKRNSRVIYPRNEFLTYGEQKTALHLTNLDRLGNDQILRKLDAEFGIVTLILS